MVHNCETTQTPCYTQLMTKKQRKLVAGIEALTRKFNLDVELEMVRAMLRDGEELSKIQHVMRGRYSMELLEALGADEQFKARRRLSKRAA